MPQTSRIIAVHYNFKASRLSIRAIRPGGALGALLMLKDAVILKGANFTVSVDRLEKWRGGCKHTRQFAEVRGEIIETLPDTLSNNEGLVVSFTPALRADFHLATTGATINKADYVRVAGKNILAFNHDSL